MTVTRTPRGIRTVFRFWSRLFSPMLPPSWLLKMVKKLNQLINNLLQFIVIMVAKVTKGQRNNLWIHGNSRVELPIYTLIVHKMFSVFILQHYLTFPTKTWILTIYHKYFHHGGENSLGVNLSISWSEIDHYDMRDVQFSWWHKKTWVDINGP